MRNEKRLLPASCPMTCTVPMVTIQRYLGVAGRNQTEKLTLVCFKLVSLFHKIIFSEKGTQAGRVQRVFSSAFWSEFIDVRKFNKLKITKIKK